MLSLVYQGDGPGVEWPMPELVDWNPHPIFVRQAVQEQEASTYCHHTETDTYQLFSGQGSRFCISEDRSLNTGLVFSTSNFVSESLEQQVVVIQSSLSNISRVVVGCGAQAQQSRNGFPVAKEWYVVAVVFRSIAEFRDLGLNIDDFGEQWIIGKGFHAGDSCAVVESKA